MMTNIRGIENTPENLVLDMPLEVTFEEITPGRIKVPYWEPVWISNGACSQSSGLRVPHQFGRPLRS